MQMDVAATESITNRPKTIIHSTTIKNSIMTNTGSIAIIVTMTEDIALLMTGMTGRDSALTFGATSPSCPTIAHNDKIIIITTTVSAATVVMQNSI
jgi:hypothetical protein